MVDAIWTAIAGGTHGLTVGGILAGLLFAVVIGLYRQLFVPGWYYRECVDRRDELESAAKTRADSNEAKIAELESLLREERARREQVPP